MRSRSCLTMQCSFTDGRILRELTRRYRGCSCWYSLIHCDRPFRGYVSYCYCLILFQLVRPSLYSASPFPHYTPLLPIFHIPHPSFFVFHSPLYTSISIIPPIRFHNYTPLFLNTGMFHCSTPLHVSVLHIS